MGKFYDSKFAKGLQRFGEKFASNRYLQAISGGLMGTMGIILLGAFFQIIAALAVLLGWTTEASAFYSFMMVPYNMSMGVISVIAAFGIAYVLAKSFQMKALSSAIVSAVVFLMVAAPAKTVTLASVDAATGMNETLAVMETGSLGGVGLFTAIIVAIVTVRITKFCEDKKIVIKMPDVVPQFLSDSFSSLIPLLINVLLFHGLNVLVQSVFMGMTLPMAITIILSIPFQGLTSLGGMLIVSLFALILWTFGIHGTMVIYTVIMVPMISIITGNAELVSQGLDPIYSPVMLFGCLAVGGAGNTFGMVLMGLRSKSEQIKAVSKAALVPGIFNINEPATFGYPIVYNPILAIPYIIGPLLSIVIGHILYTIGFLKPAYVLMLSLLPLGVSEFFTTFSWTNVLFVFLLIPFNMLVYYPFYKVYEKQLVEKEKAAREAEANTKQT